MGRAGSSFLNPNHEPPVSASAIRMPGKNKAGTDYEISYALEIDEIKALVQDYRQAALNAIDAGFDGVEIHASTGFLIDYFLNAVTNQSTDVYGGSVDNRARFALEILDAVVDALGAERTGIRICPDSKYHEAKDADKPNVWAYMTTEIQNKHPGLSYVHFIEGRAQPHNDGSINRVDSLELYRQL